MREIKFKRAHCINFHHVDEWGIRIGITGSVFTSPSSNNIAVYNKDFQYTGLKDKNEIEIYEGDILASGKDKKTRGSVEFKYGCFTWSIDENPLTQDGYESIDTELWAEVIGNIYQNPELLKFKNNG